MLAWRMAALQGEEFHVRSIWSALDAAWQFQYAVAKERCEEATSTRRCVLFFILVLANF